MRRRRIRRVVWTTLAWMVVGGLIAIYDHLAYLMFGGTAPYDLGLALQTGIFGGLVGGGIGVSLTESCAMLPGASVSGWYFAHPDARYFGVGRVDRDQVHDYARRKGMSDEDAEGWLSPSLAYERKVAR